MSSVKSDDIRGKFKEENLQKLKAIFSEQESIDENFLARYLVARKDDVDAAEAQINRVLKWNACHKPILYDEVQAKLDIGCAYVIGKAKSGRYIYCLSNHNNFTCIFSKCMFNMY